MQAPQSIVDLVERFNRHLSTYKSSKYNETEARVEFINPFFQALGWDIDNRQGKSDAYKDVVHEYALRVGDSARAPDYSFRVGGHRKFFVEAKKPSVNVNMDVSPSFQLRRYAWTAKLSLSVLTDFEEFAVYDCLVNKPSKNDKASKARVQYIKYTEYVDKWNEISSLFSREAVQQGSFDRYAQANKRRGGTDAVDKEFLKEIELWRTILAKSIAFRNRDLTQRELNFAVQCTIDRIIFLRICEDRRIEPDKQLLESIGKKNSYRRLLQIFEQADAKYNSGLFHFRQERGREDEPDTITPNIDIDDAPLKQIISNLYYPDSPYEFSVFPADVLGQVYEQFLGRVVTLNRNHSVSVEEKPEVKKAGGVYYTPTYVVEYIVETTVGKLLEGKTPNEVRNVDANGKSLKRGGPLTLLDPACGSGSFLIVTYQKLLDWYRDWYLSDGHEKHKEQIYVSVGGEWRLTASERKRILLDHVYGVDIDSQAVEVTKLSLLLKVLEGESEDTIGTQLRILKERALPDLGKNIKCGNSLIDLDFYENRLYRFDDDQVISINAFNWQSGFPAIALNGGFDVVIGNPPWVDIKGMDSDLAPYYFKKYPIAENRINLYALFMSKGLSLLHDKGWFGFIIPNSLLTQSTYGKTRELIRKLANVETIVRLPDDVFDGVTAETAITILKRTTTERKATNVVIYDRKSKIRMIDDKGDVTLRSVDLSEVAGRMTEPFNIFTDSALDNLIEKIRAVGPQLGTIADFSLGLTPYDKYKGHTTEQIHGRVFHSTTKKSSAYKRLLSGKNLQRYFITDDIGEYIKYGPWLGAPREPRFFRDQRTIVRQIVNQRIFAVYTDEELYFTQIGFAIISKNTKVYSNELITAIMNSKLMSFYHRQVFLDQSKETFQKILIQDVKQFPIPSILPGGKEEFVKRANELRRLVIEMQQYQRQLAESTITQKSELIAHRLKTTDGILDQIIYELYGLKEEEIKAIK